MEGCEPETQETGRSQDSRRAGMNTIKKVEGSNRSLRVTTRLKGGFDDYWMQSQGVSMMICSRCDQVRRRQDGADLPATPCIQTYSSPFQT